MKCKGILSPDQKFVDFNLLHVVRYITEGEGCGDGLEKGRSLALYLRGV